MADKIEAQYDTLQNVSKKFAARAQSLREVVGAARNKADGLLGSGFKGKAADAFQADFVANLMPRLDRLVTALDTASQTSNTIHDTIQSADEQAQACFKTQSH